MQKAQGVEKKEEALVDKKLEKLSEKDLLMMELISDNEPYFEEVENYSNEALIVDENQNERIEDKILEIREDKVVTDFNIDLQNLDKAKIN